MKKIILLSLLAVISTAFTYSQDITWKNDPAHSRLGFTVKHLTISEIDGRFAKFDVTVTTNGTDYTNAKVELNADISSIDTDVDMRDDHLRSPDFFDAANFPTLKFVSTSFEKLTDNMGLLKGNLTLKGVTKPVVLNVSYWGTVTNPMNKQETAGFKITGDINRKDFGIGDSFPESVVSETIKITANVEFSPVKN